MPRLTRRQEQVVRLVAEGHTNKRIAAELGISERAVKALVSRLFDAYGVANRAALLAAVLARKPLEGEALRASDFAAYRDAPFLVTVLRGPDLAFVFANRAYLRVAGATGTRLIGRTIAEAFPDAAGQLGAVLRGAYRTGVATAASRHHARWKDTEGRWREGTFSTIVQPLRDATGEVAGLLTIGAPAEGPTSN